MSGDEDCVEFFISIPAPRRIFFRSLRSNACSLQSKHLKPKRYNVARMIWVLSQLGFDTKFINCNPPSLLPQTHQDNPQVEDPRPSP